MHLLRVKFAIIFDDGPSRYFSYVSSFLFLFFPPTTACLERENYQITCARYCFFFVLPPVVFDRRVISPQPSSFVQSAHDLYENVTHNGAAVVRTQLCSLNPSAFSGRLRVLMSVTSDKLNTRKTKRERERETMPVCLLTYTIRIRYRSYGLRSTDIPFSTCRRFSRV